MYYILYTYSGV